MGLCVSFGAVDSSLFIGYFRGFGAVPACGALLGFRIVPVAGACSGLGPWGRACGRAEGLCFFCEVFPWSSRESAPREKRVFLWAVGQSCLPNWDFLDAVLLCRIQ